MNADGQYEAELESILDMRWHLGKLQVLCKYLGYPASEAEWHDYSPLDPDWDSDRALVVHYQATHPPLPHPPKKISKKVKFGLLPPPKQISALVQADSVLSSPPVSRSRRSTRLKG